MNDNLFLKRIEDKYRQFLGSSVITATDFLSIEEQSMCRGLVSDIKHELGQDGAAFLFGGYEDSERRQLVFMPDWTCVRTEQEAFEYFKENPDLSPMVILEVKVSKHDTGRLGHRDYLGALMGEGIKREVIGDILVNPNGAQILCKTEISDFLINEFRQAGHVSLNCEVKNISEISLGEIRTEIQRLNVASPRLDNVIASTFNLSRKDAVTAISRGLVFIDGAENLKPDYQLKDGQKMVLRGKGKAFYLGQTGTSKKGKAYIEIKKYL